MAGKRKNAADNWLPPRVYRGRASYEFHPKGGGSIILGAIPKDGNETESVKAWVWAEYAKAKENPVSKTDVSALIDAFHKSPQFAELAASTQRDYIQCSKRIGRVFGHMQPDNIKPPHIRQFMDAMREKGILAQTNRHHSYLSRLFSWGIERAWCLENPAKQVRKFKEMARDRYVEDWEYDITLKVARESSYPYVAPMMEHAYMCRARTIELLRLTEADIRQEGIYLRRRKGSISEITGWTDRLRAAVAEARSLFPYSVTLTTRPLFHNKNGLPIPAESFKTAWNRVMKDALKAGLKERFTFHDLKAKGVTDHETKASGHKTKKMQAVYDRKPSVTPATK